MLKMKSCGKKTTRKLKNKKADDGNRTRLSSLGSWRSTDELHLLKCGGRNQNFCRLFYFNLKYLICQFFFMTEGYKLGYDTITITGNGNRFRKIFHVYNSSVFNL